jgi:hypothetical protein
MKIHIGTFKKPKMSVVVHFKKPHLFFIGLAISFGCAIGLGAYFLDSPIEDLCNNNELFKTWIDVMGVLIVIAFTFLGIAFGILAMIFLYTCYIGNYEDNEIRITNCVECSGIYLNIFKYLSYTAFAILSITSVFSWYATVFALSNCESKSIIKCIIGCVLNTIFIIIGIIIIINYCRSRKEKDKEM